MKRVILLASLILLLLTGCSDPGSRGVRLDGTYVGTVYSGGYAIGAMGLSVTTERSTLDGAACFVAIDYSEACNYLSGSVSGNDVSFRVGGLRFTGTSDGNYVDTTFRSDDGDVYGSVYFTRNTSTNSLDVAAAGVTEMDGDSADGLSDAFLSSLLAPR